MQKITEKEHFYGYGRLKINMYRDEVNFVFVNSSFKVDVCFFKTKSGNKLLNSKLIILNNIISNYAKYFEL